jgi:hypothetical protein
VWERIPFRNPFNPLPKSVDSDSAQEFVHMTRSDLAAFGLELVNTLDQVSAGYHVKSDQHEIIGWESAVIRAKTKHLQHGAEIAENLKDSIWLGSWGKSYRWSEQELLEKVRLIHEMFEQLRNEEFGS